MNKEFNESIKNTILEIGQDNNIHYLDDVLIKLGYDANDNTIFYKAVAIYNRMIEKNLITKGNSVGFNFIITYKGINPTKNDLDLDIFHEENIHNKESWYQKNIKYFYYSAGLIAFLYAFIKWIFPLFN